MLRFLLVNACLETLWHVLASQLTLSNLPQMNQLVDDL
jgi:hypothetical protein